MTSCQWTNVMQLASWESVAGWEHGTRNVEVPGSKHAFTVIWICLSTVPAELKSSTMPLVFLKSTHSTPSYAGYMLIFVNNVVVTVSSTPRFHLIFRNSILHFFTRSFSLIYFHSSIFAHIFSSIIYLFIYLSKFSFLFTKSNQRKVRAPFQSY